MRLAINSIRITAIAAGAGLAATLMTPVFGQDFRNVFFRALDQSNKDTGKCITRQGNEFVLKSCGIDPGNHIFRLNVNAIPPKGTHLAMADLCIALENKQSAFEAGTPVIAVQCQSGNAAPRSKDWRWVGAELVSMGKLGNTVCLSADMNKGDPAPIVIDFCWNKQRPVRWFVDYQ